MRTLFAPILLALWLALPSMAMAEIARPTLDGGYETWNVPVGGGSHTFTTGVDGCVQFPDASIVTNHVYVAGGKTVIVGCNLTGGAGYANAGGHIKVPKTTNSVVLSVGNLAQAGAHYFIEGMYLDGDFANGGGVDLIAMRNHNSIQYTVTVQNVYGTGNYYFDDGNHGDIIQNQSPTNGAGGIDLVVENLAGLVESQGFFIPCRTTGTCTADLTNVYMKHVPNPDACHNYFWFWNLAVAEDKRYPVTLDNIWLDYGVCGRFTPNTGSTTAGVYSWTGTADDAFITGTINQGVQPENIFDDYAANTGLNYDRDWFFPAADPGGSCTAISGTSVATAATYSADSGNFNAQNPASGLHDGIIDGSAAGSPGNAGITSFWVEYDLGADYDLDSARLCGDADGTWISETWTLEYDEDPKDGWTAHFTAADASDNAWFNSTSLTAVDNVRYVRVTVNATTSTQAREFELEATLSATAPASTRLVTSADASDDATNITLSNEIKGDLNALIGEFDALSAVVTGLLTHSHTSVPGHTHDSTEITSVPDHTHPADLSHTHDTTVSLQKQYTWCLKHETVPACADFLPPE